MSNQSRRFWPESTVTGTFDVLGLGCLAVDELLFLPCWPEPDTKTRLTGRDRQGGGLTGNALVAAARYGARCAYAGPLGLDPDSQFLRDLFAHEGIDLTNSTTLDEARPIRSTILVDQKNRTRTILFDLAGSVGALPHAPDDSVILRTKVLFVDHYGIEGMIRAARLARAHGIPVVADLERNEWPGFETLLALVDHLIVTRAFATKLTGQSDPAQAVVDLWKPDRQAVVVTCGEEGAWWCDKTHSIPTHLPAFPTEVVDTTGCGDAFHGIYAACLAKGDSLETRLLHASAGAALKARHAGAQRGLPAKEAIVRFVNELRVIPSE